MWIVALAAEPMVQTPTPAYAEQMHGFEETTWRAIGITLTVVGLALSTLIWKRRGAASGLRAVAWSLLPAAAGLTGTLRLLWRIGDLVGSWAVHLVFSPVVWLGLILAVASMVLFAVSSAVGRRGLGQPDRAATLPGSRGSKASLTTKRGSTADPEIQEIEEILRQHGIK